ncbi:Cytochrome P450 CYP2 subfamily [Handroanthus impetiginosus]|uniref:Flavonoid-6-hydroxylase n=1 Tax=Handroanthus impetiginosus TaxID=429701 RepID=A0A2G9H917_9LAMI|nr:Cytochrome P450 CYP2 subfamily [Handroanthus impetiginosus]
MDLLPFIIEITLFLSAITFYILRKSITTLSITSQTTAPEPPGAWPIIGHLHLLSGQTPVARILGAMADKYGPIFSLRLGSHPGLVVSSWETIKDCFTTNDRVFATRPSLAVGKYLCYNYAVFALAPYGPYWREIRKVVTLQLMTAHRLDMLSPIRTSEVNIFIKKLYYDIPNKVELNTSFENLTFNIILRKLAGKRLTSEDWQLKEAIKKALYLSGVFVYSDAIPSLEWLDIGGYIKGMKESAKEIDEVLTEWVKDRIRNGIRKGEEGEMSDFLEVMLSSIPENGEVSGYDRETVIKATMLILILTGSESTAETLIWALSLLLNNPQAMEMAQQELQTNIGPLKWVQESDIKNLKYLQAIVKETLRLYPPGPLGGPREATEDCYVGNYYVPKGTRLVVNLWKLHRDPNVWSDPNEFRPERFLDEHNRINFKGQCFEYIPFTSGRRMCPGMIFGLQVIEFTLARLLQGFNISTPMGDKVDMGEGLGIALPKLKPLEVVLTPRLERGLYESL